jgi:hypothetical protein
MMIMWSMGCSAQDRLSDDPSEIIRDEWQTQIKTAREHLEAMRRERKSLAPRTLTAEEVAAEASQRVIEDESLMPGDIVSTSQGLFQFKGSRNGGRRPEDFVKMY